MACDQANQFIIAELGADGRWWATDDRLRSVHEANETLLHLRLNRDGKFHAFPCAREEGRAL